MADMATPARVSIITLGVSDVATATSFYQVLGWPLSTASVPDEVSFFHTAGAILALYGVDALAAEANQVLAPGQRFRGVATAINCDRAQDVDEVIQSVILAGGTVTSPPRATDWGGYSGYFADPDGHVWEVAYNPSFPLGSDGRLELP
jgi:predicted lactoylglutathione lyase